METAHSYNKITEGFMCKNYANVERYSSLLVHRNIEIISFVVYLNIKKCNRLKFFALD